MSCRSVQTATGGRMPSRRQAPTPRTLSTVDAAMGVPFLVRWRASRLKQACSRILASIPRP